MVPRVPDKVPVQCACAMVHGRRPQLKVKYVYLCMTGRAQATVPVQLGYSEYSVVSGRSDAV